MEKRQPKKRPVIHHSSSDEEVSSIEWKRVKMTEQEVDLVYKMHKLVGDRWELIAGRIPGRKPEEIERFWIMRQRQDFGTTKSIQS